MPRASDMSPAAGNLTHFIWDCSEAKLCWTYIVSHWSRLLVTEGHLLRYKQADLSRQAFKLPTWARADIKRRFPDNADNVGHTWKQMWWIACSVCVTALWIQRNRSVHNQDSMTPEQVIAEVRSILVQQLRAVAIKTQRHGRNRADSCFFQHWYRNCSWIPSHIGRLNWTPSLGAPVHRLGS